MRDLKKEEKRTLEAGIPQVFCHRVRLLIQPASVEPFLAQYKDQDWKKNTEGTFRERGVKLGGHRSNEKTAQDCQKDQAGEGRRRMEKQGSMPEVSYR